MYVCKQEIQIGNQYSHLNVAEIFWTETGITVTGLCLYGEFTDLHLLHVFVYTLKKILYHLCSKTSNCAEILNLYFFSGTKPEHFAKIAWKNHKHSTNNP